MHFFCSELWLRVYAFVSLMPGRGMLPCMQPSLFDEKHQLAQFVPINALFELVLLSDLLMFS